MPVLSELSAEGRAVAQEFLEPHLGEGRKTALCRGTLARVVPDITTLGGRVQTGRTARLVERRWADLWRARTISTRLRKAVEGLAHERPAFPLSSVHRQVTQSKTGETAS